MIRRSTASRQCWLLIPSGIANLVYKGLVEDMETSLNLLYNMCIDFAICTVPNLFSLGKDLLVETKSDEDALQVVLK